jgi:hypothetical protein
VPGFVGFAIGRSIWWDALIAHRDGGTAEAARDQISRAYLDFAQYYLSHEESGLPES